MQTRTIQVKDNSKLIGSIYGEYPRDNVSFMKARATEISQGARVYMYMAHGTYRPYRVKTILFDGTIVLSGPNPINPHSNTVMTTLNDLYIKVD